MAVELRHEALAERHDLAVALALRVEVGAALAAADRQAGQGVLEDLLEAEELDDAEVDGRVQAQAALVRADRGVELHAVAAVDMDLAVVVYPRHAELDLALRLRDALQDAGGLILRVGLDDRLQGGEDLGGRLDKLRFVCVEPLELGKLFAYIRHFESLLALK